MGDLETVVGCVTAAQEIRCYQRFFERLNWMKSVQNLTSKT